MPLAAMAGSDTDYMYAFRLKALSKVKIFKQKFIVFV